MAGIKIKYEKPRAIERQGLHHIIAIFCVLSDLFQITEITENSGTFRCWIPYCHQDMGHYILMKLDLNYCSNIKQYVMEDKFSFWNVMEIHVIVKSIDQTWFSYDHNVIA